MAENEHPCRAAHTKVQTTFGLLQFAEAKVRGGKGEPSQDSFDALETAKVNHRKSVADYEECTGKNGLPG